MATERDRAAEILDQKTRSREWLENNYWAQFESVWKNYHLERDPEPDPQGHDSNYRGAAYGTSDLYGADGRKLANKYDPSQSSLGMPDTWALVRRLVARYTAQIPNLKFIGSEAALADRVSRKIMRDWDRGHVQRYQKKHVAQSALFGWSVRPWFWRVDEQQRRRRINPLDPARAASVAEQYGIDPADAEAVAKVIGEKGRGNLLPVNYTRKLFEGPGTEFLFVGDCYPEPNFQTIQSSKWFIVERQRNKEWLEALGKTYKKELQPGIDQLFKDYPNGTPAMRQSGYRGDARNLRERLSAAIGRVTNPASTTTSNEEVQGDWLITERHVPGADPTLAYVATTDSSDAGGIFLGEIPYPYDLDGKIAFTELVLIDDLLAGIGDSHARMIRGLQLLHERQVNARFDLVFNILRPLMYTTSQHLWENPDLLKRYSGFRLVKVSHPNDVGVLGEQAALAAAAAGMQDEGGIMRLIQQASGENNMSMQSNVDPAQSRTATGARIMAYMSDVLSKDGIDMFTETSLKPDAEMMYELNRSEMPEAVTFDAAPYYRSYNSQQPVPERDEITVEPSDFQEDGEVDVEVGSTLADDDEAKVQKAQTLWQIFAGNPVVNQEKLRDRVLIALGEGRHLKEWAAPPPPPSEEEIRKNLTVSAKFELLSAEQQAKFLGEAGMEAPPPPGGGPPPPPPGRPEPVPLAPPDEELLATGAAAAARGRSPMNGQATA